MLELFTLFTIGLFASALPGPDILYISRSTLDSGLRTGLIAASGVLFASLFYISAVGMGLGKIGQNPYFQIFIGIFGSVYLIWIAYSIWDETIDLRSKGQSDSNRWHIFFKGMAVHFSNPKAIIFFSVVLAPFLHKNNLLQQIFALTLGHMSTFFGLSFLISRFDNFFTPRRSMLINRFSALLFLFFATELLWHSWLAVGKI